MLDLVIVGARCAGASLGLLTARAGLRVLVLERARFPCDTISGHFIQPSGVACLRRWGLLERLRATGTPPLDDISFDFGSIALTGRPMPDADGHGTGYGPRRQHFDPLLAQAAVEAGARLWEGVSFEGPMLTDGRVSGVVARTGSGRRLRLPARMVIGADGRSSRVARTVQARSYDTRPGTTCGLYSYFEGFAASHTHLFARPGRFHVVMPTDAGRTFVGVLRPAADAARVRANPAQVFAASMAEIPWIAERLGPARRAERFTAIAGLDGFFRQAHGPGWALLGDAGYHRDPITAQGMSDAFVHAELLAQALIQGLGGARALDAALRAFHFRRDELVRPMYALTHDLARLEPPPSALAQRIECAATDPQLRRQFFGVLAGTVPVGTFFGGARLAA